MAAHLALQNTTWAALPRMIWDMALHGGVDGVIHTSACRHAELSAEAIIEEIRNRIAVGLRAADAPGSDLPE